MRAAAGTSSHRKTEDYCPRRYMDVCPLVYKDDRSDAEFVRGF
jgi:hypothetical protein